ncbi:MAG: hypothetical protein ACTSWW_11590, partial [Promethearchaeota archaeon]
EKLAKVSYENGIADSEYFIRSLGSSQSLTVKFATFPDRLTSLARIIFPKEMQNWFEKCQVVVENDMYIFEGVHALGPNFSLFIKELLTFYSVDTKYELCDEYYGEQIEKIKRKDQKMDERSKYTVKFIFRLRGKPSQETIQAKIGNHQ